jgi:FeS assembly SUF system protein
MIEQEVGKQEVIAQEVGEQEVSAQEVSEAEVREIEVSEEEVSPLEVPTNLETPIIEVLHTCFDPEIPVDIYELGLIYGIDIQPSGEVNIRMTLTSPGCPVAGSLPGEVEEKVRSVPGVTAAKVELVWDPPWCMDNMSEAAKLQLGMF